MEDQQRPTYKTAPPSERKRSIAWLFYAAIAVASPFVLPGVGSLGLSVLCAAYAIYLFRGGRIVVWIW